MRLLQTLTFTTLILQASFARYRRPRPNMMGVLQNLLAPNAERTLVKMPQRSPVQYSPPIIPLPEAPCNQRQSEINQLPVPVPNMLPVQMPNAVPIQYPNPTQIQLPNPTPIALQSQPIQLQNPPQMQLPNPTQIQLQTPMPLLPNPTPIQLQNPAQYQLPSPTPYQLPKPAQIQLQNPTQIVPNVGQIQMPNLTPAVPVAQHLPENVLEKPNHSSACQREIIYPSPEITANLFTSITEPVPLTPNQDIYGCPIPSPASLFNPMVPAASPVSAWTQEVLPEATSGVRSQFLRKIPIPPPTL